MLDKIEKIPVQMITTDEEYDQLSQDDPQIKSLAKSILESGLLVPIIINKDYKIVVGRKRLLAHKINGLIDIKAIVRKFDSEFDEINAGIIENLERKHYTVWELHEQVDRQIALYERFGIKYRLQGGNEPDKLDNPATIAIKKSGKSRTRFYAERKPWNELVSGLKKVVKDLDLSVERTKDLSLMSKEDQEHIVSKLEDEDSTEAFRYLQLIKERSPELNKRVKIDRGYKPPEVPIKKKPLEQSFYDRKPFALNRIGSIESMIDSPPYQTDGWVMGIRFIYNSKKKLFRYYLQLENGKELTSLQEKALNEIHELQKDVKGYTGVFYLEPQADNYLVNGKDKITSKTKTAFFNCTSNHESLF